MTNDHSHSEHRVLGGVVAERPATHDESQTPSAADRTLRAGSVAVVLAVLGACALLAIVQLIDRDRIAVAHRYTGSADTQAERPAEVDSTVDMAVTLSALPVSVDGFRTTARHNIPGFEGTAAEAIYTPLDENVSIRMPLNCYVVVRAPEAGSSIEREFARVAERYPARVEPGGLDVLDPAESFVVRERGRYVVAWAHPSYVILVDTRFTMAVPEEPEEVLSMYAEAVIAAVSGRIAR